MTHGFRLGRPVISLLLGAALGGCAHLQQLNRTDWIDGHLPARNESDEAFAAKAAFWYPLRDMVTLDPLIRKLGGDPAWNVDATGRVADSSFFTNRRLKDFTDGHATPDPCTNASPQAPWTVIRIKSHGATSGFVGHDDTGRKFHVKLDNADWPELGTGAEVVGARILWLLGYHVPPVFAVTISGTGDARLDGRRAAASLYLDGDVRGHFPFDWLRYRREFRAARLACAWINDVDRAANNNLVVVRDGRACFYLLDFNSALGSWNGVPKQPWQGRRYRCDPAWSWLRTLFPGLNSDGFDPNRRIVSAAVGRFDAEFDPRTWQPNLPNTAFDHLTDQDAAWMARKIESIPDALLREAVSAASYSDPTDAEYLYQTLLHRREKILDTYLPVN